MYDPGFDPLNDLNYCMSLLEVQRQQIDLLMKISHQQQLAIDNLNKALSVAGKRLVYMEQFLNEIK